MNSAQEEIPAVTTRFFTIDSISLGERAGRDTGSVKKLAQSISADGLSCPVTVSSRNRLITGVRRVAAHQLLGRQCIEGRVIHTVADALYALMSEQADGRNAKPLSLSEILVLDKVMREELAWWERRPPGRRVMDSGGHNAEIAAVFGLNTSQYTKARELYAASRGYREHLGSRTLVGDDARRQASAAIARLRRKSEILSLYEAFKGMPEAVRSPSGRLIRVRGPEASITSALGMLRGITTGLRQVDFAEIQADGRQVAQWAADLDAGLAVLKGFQRKIKEI